MRFHIVVLDDDSPHLQAFSEMVRALAASLRDLGHGCAVTWHPMDCVEELEDIDGKLIVFGACRRPAARLPDGCAVFNTEQIASPWFTAEYVSLLRRHLVIDYSAWNAGQYGAIGLRKPVVAPFGWHGSLRVDTEPLDQIYDVIHIGAETPRRKTVLDQLEETGLRVCRVTCTYGEQRDRLLMQSRVLLNIHAYDFAQTFESARVLMAVANGIPTVTEPSGGGEGLPGCFVAPLSELAQTCVRLVRDHEVYVDIQRQIKEHGRDALMIHGAAQIVRAFKRKPEKLVLTMVLRDEEKVVRRAVASAKPYIQACYISYNGVSEETLDIVRDELAGIPLRVERDPWISYGRNRNEALDRAARLKLGTHALILDADEVIEHWEQPESYQDACVVNERMGGFVMRKIRVVRFGAGWAYQGAVHEALVCSQAGKTTVQTGSIIANLRDGAGSTVPAQERYVAEAKMLQAELEKNSADTRSQFYYAQSLDCAGLTEQAIAAYAKRAGMMDGFEEERWLALLRIAEIYMRLPDIDHMGLVPLALHRAHEARPQRGEPLLRLGFWWWRKGCFTTAEMFLLKALDLPVPPGDVLCVEHGAHRAGWAALDLLALCWHGLGRSARAVEAASIALKACPEDQRERIGANLKLFKDGA